MSLQEMRFLYTRCDDCFEEFSQEIKYTPIPDQDVVIFDRTSPLVVAIETHHKNNNGHNMFNFYRKRSDLKEYVKNVGFIVVSSQNYPQGTIDH